MANFQQHKYKWQRMAKIWALFSKPGRPSQEDIKNFDILLKIAIKNKKEPTILVLGATPEIRKLLYIYSKNKGAKIICADMLEDNYRAMSSFIKKKNPKEKLVKVNWLELSKKIKQNSIDVVIGDYVRGNVGGFEDNFYKEIKKILTGGGYFIVRDQWMTGRVRKKIKLETELKRLTQKVKNKELTVNEASSYFANHVIFAGWFKNKENKISLSYFEKEINDFALKVRASKDKTLRLVFNWFLRSWWQMKDKYWINYSKGGLLKIIKKHFKVEKILFSNDYEIAKESPIFLLRKS